MYDQSYASVKWSSIDSANENALKDYGVVADIMNTYSLVTI